MSIKHTLLLSAVFTLFTVSPTYSGNIISCDSFETCPDGVTCSALIVGLESEVSALQARIVELEAEVVERTAFVDLFLHQSETLIEINAPYGDLIWRDARNQGQALWLQSSNLRNGSLNFRTEEYIYLHNNNLSYADFSGLEALRGGDFRNNNMLGADLAGTDLTGVNWVNNICPDGSNSDTNGLNACVPLP